MQRDQHLVPDRAVWSHFVVVSTPFLHFAAGIVKAHEPVGVQTLGTELTVEGLDERVVGGLARPREVERDILLISPQIEIPGDEFGALVDADGLRLADRLTDPFEGTHDILTAVAEPRIDRRRVARIGVDNGQHPELPACSQLIVHEVHGPGLVRPGGYRTIVTKLGLHAPLRTVVTRKLRLNIELGEARYVKFSVGFGWMIGWFRIEAIDPDVAREEMKRISALT